jgi:hypothetical protein
MGRVIIRRLKIHPAVIGAQCLMTFSEIMAERATVSYCEVESALYRSHFRALFRLTSLTQCKEVV